MAVDLEYYGVPPADYREQELRNTITTSAGQTTISAPYSVGYVDVYFNGAKLDRFTEFTATDGANIVLATAASAGDTVEVISRAQVQLANVYTQQQVNALLVPYFGTATGTGDAQVLVTTPTFTSYVDGMDIKVRTVGANTVTNPTIAINGLPAKTIVFNNSGSALYDQDWFAGSEITLRYNQTLDKLIIIAGCANAYTQNQFNNTNRFATTSFVQQSIGNWSSYAVIGSSRSITAADLGKAIFISASGQTVTLPTPTSLNAPVGSAITIFTATTLNGTVVPGSGAVLNGPGTASVGSFVLGQGHCATFLAVTGTTWQVVNSTAGLGQTSDFLVSMTSNGYQKLPSGLIIQWGSLTIGANTSSSVTFPIAFPANCYAITHGFLLSGGNFYMTGVNSITLTGFSFMNPNTGSATSEHWIAIGR